MCFLIAFSPILGSFSSESLCLPSLPSDILLILQNPARVLFSLLFPGEAAPRSSLPSQQQLDFWGYH